MLSLQCTKPTYQFYSHMNVITTYFCWVGIKPFNINYNGPVYYKIQDTQNIHVNFGLCTKPLL